MTTVDDIDNADERMVIAVDFDKTLTTGDGKPFWDEDEDETVNEEARAFVNECYRNGHVVIIWTARPWSEAANVESYLKKWEVEYHGLRCDKMGADVFIDDKALNINDLTPDLDVEEVEESVKESDGPIDGEVVFYNNVGDYGFLSSEDYDEDIFFHDVSYHIEEGDVFSFDVKEAEKGPKAENMQNKR